MESNNHKRDSFSLVLVTDAGLALLSATTQLGSLAEAGYLDDVDIRSHFGSGNCYW